MNTPTNVVHLRQPEELEDPLTDILRSGARRLLAQAVELEAETFLAGMQARKLPDGRDRLVRHGYGPERAAHPRRYRQAAPGQSPQTHLIDEERGKRGLHVTPPVTINTASRP